MCFIHAENSERENDIKQNFVSIFNQTSLITLTVMFKMGAVTSLIKEMCKIITKWGKI